MSSSPSSPTLQSTDGFDNDYKCENVLPNISDPKLRFRHLLCSYIGTHENKFHSRLQTLVKNVNSSIFIKDIKVQREEMIEELKRRRNFLRQPGNKMKRHTGLKVRELEEKLNSDSVKLPDDEIVFIERELERYIREKEQECAEKETFLAETGKEISKTDRERMRLWEAVFFQ